VVCNTKNSKDKITFNYVGFVAFKVVTMKNAVFLDVAPCGSCEKRRLGRKSRHQRWRRHVPPKRRYSQHPHGATSQKTTFFSLQLTPRSLQCYHLQVIITELIRLNGLLNHDNINEHCTATRDQIQEGADRLRDLTDFRTSFIQNVLHCTRKDAP
jgi:hypothetical protein